MIRMGLFLTIIMVTVNAGLLLTGDLDDNGAFANLSGQINEIRDLEAGTDISDFSSSTQLGATDTIPDFLGYIDSLTQIAIALVSIAGFLLTGSIQVLTMLDPSNTWNLILLAPIAVFQLFYLTFLIITIASALLGSLRGLLGG